MGHPLQTFRDLSDGTTVTLMCADGTEIRGTVQHSDVYVEDGVRCWSREVQDADHEAWVIRHDETQTTLRARLEGYDKDKKMATTREEHTVESIEISE